jgi:hypothetical protein
MIFSVFLRGLKREWKKEGCAMGGEKVKKSVLILSSLLLGVCLSVQNAQAVPSFKRQTGLSCTVCHTVFPELTAFGRAFKLQGYVFSKGGEEYEYPPPIAAMVQASYTEQRGLSNRIDPFDDSPDAKFVVPQQASIFYGGKIYNNFGAFAQLTYDGVGNSVALDNTDIRYANSLSLAGKNLTWGFTLNNNPTVQDVWNSTPAFGFPYAASSVAVTPAAATIIDGTLAQQVGGLGVYAFWQTWLYAEMSVYRTNNKGITRPLGAGTTTSMVVDNAAPYWRLVLQHHWGKQSLSLGTYGLAAKIFPGGAGNGPSDKFLDTALDAQYQFIGTKHLFSVATTWIHEKQDWDASFPMGLAANSSDKLNTFRINANYHYRSPWGTLGGTAAYFSTTGDSDTGLYSPASVTGSATGSPDSSGFILQADYVFRDQYKLALQYTLYDKFNGARTNYDGAGRDASDNNTLYLLLWLMF